VQADGRCRDRRTPCPPASSTVLPAVDGADGNLHLRAPRDERFEQLRPLLRLLFTLGTPHHGGEAAGAQVEDDVAQVEQPSLPCGRGQDLQRCAPRRGTVVHARKAMRVPVDHLRTILRATGELGVASCLARLSAT
jgi:hypothetical protein